MFPKLKAIVKEVIFQTKHIDSDIDSPKTICPLGGIKSGHYILMML